MTSKTIILSGSIRKNSFNKKLAIIAKNEMEKLNLNHELIDLKDFDMPLYNGDIEENDGIPTNVLKLHKIFQTASSFIIASPEYNGHYPPLIKNTFDWLSIVQSPIYFSGEYVGLISTSPGSLGGIRGLTALRSYLSNSGCFVIPHFLCVPSCMNAFEGNTLKDAKHLKILHSILKELK